MPEPMTLPHQLIVNERKELTVTGVSDVDSFDESAVIAHTALGDLTIKGTHLHICRLNTDTGDLSLEGEIDLLEYSQSKPAKGGRLARFFK